ncbi:hypothetical protein [Mycolicibacterium hodleri]|uniref:hypothetical protein n=1 Tax=Mycolicibacterium hodleri TaxID=49897 RepID=UPI0018778ED0|nr:hypothetical protein [Mycolicibacterium hodleri]
MSSATAGIVCRAARYRRTTAYGTSTRAALYDMTVQPTEFLAVDETRVVVVGRYHGPARDGRTAVDAAFAHVITTRGDRVAELRQITDTARWGFPQ